MQNDQIQPSSNSHFPHKPRLASYIGAKDDVSGGHNWSCKTCKALVKLSRPTNQHPFFLQTACSSCRPTNSVEALKGNEKLHNNCAFNCAKVN